MARHGYLGDDYGSEYDPNYDADDNGGGRNRDGRGGGERSNWGNEDRGGGRGFMFDERDQSRSMGRSGSGQREGGGGFFSRMGEQASSWLSDDDDNRSERSRGSDQDEWFGGRSSSERQRGQQGGRQSFSNHPDAHYHSWRDKQMQALDSDYQDYCREREQQFHQEFDSWRQNRQGQSAQGQSRGQQSAAQSSQGSATPTGSTGVTGDTGSNDELLLSREAMSTTDAPNEPMSATVSGDGGATMGQTPETTRRNR